MRRRFFGVNARARRAAVALVALAMLAGCREQGADRLYRDAGRFVERGDLPAAIERYERILRDYPGTRAADRAKSDVVLYRGLLEASRKYPLRRARDLVVQTARAVERFHRERGKWPSALGELVPAYLSSEPVDPWGRLLDYRPKAAGGYVLGCRGADGADGGSGDSADILVEDGKFVKGGSEGEP